MAFGMQRIARAVDPTKNYASSAQPPGLLSRSGPATAANPAWQPMARGQGFDGAPPMQQQSGMSARLPPTNPQNLAQIVAAFRTAHAQRGKSQ